MKPIFYGLEKLIASQTTRVPTDVIDVSSLIDTFERNFEQKMPNDWLQKYEEISQIYIELFTDGQLSDETLEKVPFETIEIAQEHINDDLSLLLKQPRANNGRDYYYEFARSFGVENTAANLKEHLGEEVDFI